MTRYVYPYTAPIATVYFTTDAALLIFTDKGVGEHIDQLIDDFKKIGPVFIDSPIENTNLNMIDIYELKGGMA